MLTKPLYASLAVAAFGLIACTPAPVQTAPAGPGGTASRTGPVAPGIQAWWRAEGNAADQQGHAPGTFQKGDNGTNGDRDGEAANGFVLRDAREGAGILTQNGVRWANGKVGFAFALDGVDDHVVTPLRVDMSAKSPGVTYAAWVYPTKKDDGRRQVISPDDGGYDWSILQEQGRWHVFNGVGSVDTGYSVDLDQWQHVAAVFQPGVGVSFYMNGVKWSTSDIQACETVNAVMIGDNPAFDEYFPGLIDEAQVYSRALSDSEITSLATVN